VRLLVTGASGFVGGHVLRGLADDGHLMAVVVRRGSDASRIDGRAEILVHDGSTAGLHDLVDGFRPDAALHLASRFVAQHQPEDIDALIEANLRFGCQLLDAMSRCEVGALVDFGTSWQHFHTAPEAPDAYHPVSLYAATKQAFQDLVRFYAEARGLCALTLKLSDTYGPGDTRAKLIALLDRISASGETLAMSPGEQAFNLAHVDDVVGAVRVALERVLAAAPGSVESYAVRGEEQLSLRDFVQLYSEVTGRTVNIAWGERPYRDREVMQPWLGPLLPGWRQQIPLRQGLAELARDV